MADIVTNNIIRKRLFLRNVKLYSKEPMTVCREVFKSLEERPCGMRECKTPNFVNSIFKHWLKTIFLSFLVSF